jgi:hypothetical protein
MVAGQSVLSRPLDVGALSAVEVELDQAEQERHALHAGQLRRALRLQALYSAAGMGMGSVAQLALVLRCSEFRAGQLLGDALTLTALPGAIEALESGLWTVEQSRVFVKVTDALSEPARLAVWDRLCPRLQRDLEQGVVCPPGRLEELLRGWVIAADPADAVARRRQAEAAGAVDYRRREDGLADIFALGLTGPVAQACLQRIRERAAGPDDGRSPDKRRLDAFAELILGRDTLFGSAAGHCQPGCECRPGSPVPCGAQVQVLVPLGAALGTTDELAELVGHGPLEPDLLAELLLSAPELRAVWVDEHGIPVATGDTVLRPERDDHAGLREALLQLAGMLPGARQPVHPDDHGPPDGPGPPERPDPPPDDSPRPVTMSPTRIGELRRAARSLPRPGLLTRPHPFGTPGAYRVPRWLRRLLIVRRPRCEWPGCGIRATRCDLDHDLPWPYGPTCACQVGPLCRRHHRVKQLGWTKHRTGDGAVRWTSPTGRTWTSPSPHQPPQAPVRQLPALPPPPGPLERLSPVELDAELWQLDPGSPLWDDPAAHELRAQDREPDDDHDPLAAHILSHNARWTIDLNDPYAWTDLA